MIMLFTMPALAQEKVTEGGPPISDRDLTMLTSIIESDVRGILAAGVSALNTLATRIKTSKSPPANVLREAFKQTKKDAKGAFRAILFIDNEGMSGADSSLPDGKIVDLSDREYWQIASQLRYGESYIGKMIRGRRSGRLTIPVAAPLFDTHKRRLGVVVGWVSPSKLAKARSLFCDRCIAAIFRTSNGQFIGNLPLGQKMDKGLIGRILMNKNQKALVQSPFLGLPARTFFIKIPELGLVVSVTVFGLSS